MLFRGNIKPVDEMWNNTFIFIECYPSLNSIKYFIINYTSIIELMNCMQFNLDNLLLIHYWLYKA